MQSPLFRTLALGAVAVALASCGGGREVRRLSCPATVLAPHLDTYTVTRPGMTGPGSIRFGVRLVDLRSTCRGEEGGIAVDTEVTFETARNDPDLRQGDFSYFVAVADKQQNILAKQIFSLRANYALHQNEMRIRDNVSEHLPLKDVSTGRNYTIIVGLQVSQQQLDLNRGKPPAPGGEASPSTPQQPPVSLPPPVSVPPQ